MAFSYANLYNISTIGLRFLQFMDLGVGQIWFILNLQKIFLKKFLLMFMEKAICTGILLVLRHCRWNIEIITPEEKFFSGNAHDNVS